MTKINPYDLPPEEKRNIRITLTNIKWETNNSNEGDFRSSANGIMQEDIDFSNKDETRRAFQTIVNALENSNEEAWGEDELYREVKDAAKALTLPEKMCIPVDPSLPEEEMLAKAMDIASSAIGYGIIDCDVTPIDLPSEDESLSDTLDYEGSIF
jgi:hypothetical protein